MIIKTINITLGVLVAFTVWSYAVAFTYVVVSAVLLSYHLIHS
jgi:hypothetical protein